MAYSSSVVSSDELAALAADKPLFLTRNVLLDRVSDPTWRTSGGTEVNHTDDQYDPIHAADGYCDVPTKPAVQSPTIGTYDLRFELDDDGALTVDGIAVLGHNLGTIATALSATITVTASIDNDSGFGGGDAVTLATWTVSPGDSDARLVELDMDRYVSVPWFRLRIASTVAFTSTYLPEIGEIFLGRRRQLDRKPDRPYDARATRSEVVRVRAKSGGLTSYEMYRGAADLSMTWSAHDGTDADTGIDAVSVLRAWYADTRQGADPCIYIEDPETAPEIAHVVALSSPGQRFNFELINIGEITIALDEYPPFVELER